MSFYRSVFAVVAAMGVAGAVLAATGAATTTPPAHQPTAAVTQDTKVNVNTATAKDLMKVKGLNAAKAKSIVSYRKKHGEFKSLDDLKMVRSLKKLNDDAMKSLQDQLTIG